MSSFGFDARDGTGAAVSGEVRADTPQEAARRLADRVQARAFRQASHTIAAARTAVDRVKINLPWPSPLFRKIATSNFCRAFAMFSGAGVSVHEALVISGEKAGRVEESIDKVVDHLAAESTEASGKSAMTVSIISYLIIAALILIAFAQWLALCAGLVSRAAGVSRRRER